MCELDIIFNFEKAYFMLDEMLLGGELQESSKKNILKAIAAQDAIQEVSAQSSLAKSAPVCFLFFTCSYIFPITVTKCIIFLHENVTLSGLTYTTYS